MTDLILTPVIAIDGTAASGKGTLAKKLGAHLGYAVLDTGALYRCVALLTVRRGWSVQDHAAAETAALALAADLRDDPSILTDPALRTAETGDAASIAAAIPAVRQALVDLQRGFAAQPPALPDDTPARGAILDGRDIGTVICPDAKVKFYVDAPVEIRAERRFRELQASGSTLAFDVVLADMKARDIRDSTRPVSPLKPAAESILIDTGTMGPDDVFAAALAHLNR